MQRWSPALRSGIAVRSALIFFATATLCSQQASAFEGALSTLPFEPPSTMDARIPAQNLELQKTVIDFFDSSVRKRQLPKFQAPKSTEAAKPLPLAKTITPTKPVEAEPIEAAKPLPKASTSTSKSPFRKWVKPKSKADTGTEEPAAPQLARRTRRAAQPQPKTTAAPPKTKPTAPAQENYPKPAPKTLVVGPSQSELPPLTTSQLNLRKKIRRVLTHYYNRPMNTRDRSPWELMHMMLAYEAHSKVLQGGPNGKPITAVGWLCFNRACKKRTLMFVDDEGKLQARVGPALQGHRGQLLAMLAQSRISKDYPMLVEEHELTINDLIEMEQRTCYPRTELTFKLISFTHYLDSDATWMNDQGMQWNIPKLISEEIRQPVRGAACGGTHRLGGLTLAYKMRERRGEAVDGQYLKAKKFVNRYQNYAYRLQNRDGSFSTEWFRGPGNEESVDRKLKTTGHILEWLLYAATERELKSWRTTKAANFLANIMYRNRNRDWEAGPLGHAIHALLVYDRLIFSPYDQEGESPIVAKSRSNRTKK